MSSGIRASLKAAREALGAKDYKGALLHCKAALKEDKNCYEAYLYIGKAAFLLGEPAQADLAYQKAAEIKPDAAPAWQVRDVRRKRRPARCQPREQLLMCLPIDATAATCRAQCSAA